MTCSGKMAGPARMTFLACNWRDPPDIYWRDSGGSRQLDLSSAGVGNLRPTKPRQLARDPICYLLILIRPASLTIRPAASPSGP